MTSQQYPAAGGQGMLEVSTGGTCTWSARSNVAWLTITSGADAIGPGVIEYTVGANPESSTRNGTVSVWGQSATITQEGRTPEPCAYALSPDGRDFSAGGGAGEIEVSTLPHCAWTAVSSDAWVMVVSGSNGTGPGTVRYAVQGHDGTSERSASITVGGRTFTVRQDAEPPPSPDCTYAVSPTAVSLDFRGTMSYTQPVSIATEGGCPWTASSDVSWLRVAITSGSGPGTVPFTVDSYTDEPARSAPIKLRWPTVTAGQNVWVTQTGCLFSLAPTGVTFAAAGGRGMAQVMNREDICPSGCGCPWTATSPVSYIRITTSLPRYGDGEVFFTVDSNDGPARSATLTIAGKPFLVTQAGR